MTTYRTAAWEEFYELKDLWNVVFNEEPAFLEKFFSTRFDPNHVFVAEDGGRIVSALHALPSSYTKEGITNPCSFIVGAATLQSHRNRGIMSRLLERVQASYPHPITLFPALRPYYEKHGYFTTSTARAYAIPPTLALNERQKRFATPDDLEPIYRSATYRCGSLDRDELAWGFLIDGYETLYVEDGYAFILEDKAVEAFALNREAARLLLGILARRGISTIHALSASPFESFLENGYPVPMGMATDKALEGVYIAEQY